MLGKKEKKNSIPDQLNNEIKSDYSYDNERRVLLIQTNLYERTKGLMTQEGVTNKSSPGAHLRNARVQLNQVLIFSRL